LNGDTGSRALGLRKGECLNAAFLRLSEGRVTRWPTPLQRRWMRLTWHRHKVTASGQVRHERGFWGDGTTQRIMLQYAEQWVVIGLEPDNPQAAAMVYEWNDESRKGRLLLEELPAVPEAQHNDPASKQRAQSEKRRAKAMAQDEVIPDLEEKVEGLRRKLMADAGQPTPARIIPPKVTALTPNGPFSPGEARHRPVEQDAAASKTNQYFALLAQEKAERTVSGGNR